VPLASLGAVENLISAVLTTLSEKKIDATQNSDPLH
jgi:hypothetical protein